MLSPKRHIFDFRNKVNRYNINGFDCLFDIPHFSDVTFLEIEKINFFCMGEKSIVQGVNDQFIFYISSKGFNVNGTQAVVIGSGYNSKFTITLDTNNTGPDNLDYYSLADLIDQLNSKIKAKLVYDVLQASALGTTYEEMPSAIYLKVINDRVILVIEYPLSYTINTMITYYDFNVDFSLASDGVAYGPLNVLLGLINVSDPVVNNTSIQTLNNSSLMGVNQYPSIIPQTYQKPVREYTLNSNLLSKHNAMGGKLPSMLMSVSMPPGCLWGTFIEYERKLLFTWTNFQGTLIDFFLTDEDGNKVHTLSDSGSVRWGLTVYCKFYSTSETLLINN